MPTSAAVGRVHTVLIKRMAKVLDKNGCASSVRILLLVLRTFLLLSMNGSSTGLLEDQVSRDWSVATLACLFRAAISAVVDPVSEVFADRFNSLEVFGPRCPTRAWFPPRHAWGL